MKRLLFLLKSNMEVYIRGEVACKAFLKFLLVETYVAFIEFYKDKVVLDFED